MKDLQIANMAKALRHLTEPLQGIGYQENTLHWKAADALERQATRIKEFEEYVTGAEEDAEDYSKRLVIAERRVAELEADLKSREAVADSYAEENQRFHDRIKDLEAERSELIESIRQMLDEAYEQGKYESEAATIERLAQRAFLAGCGKPGCTDCIGGALAAEFRTLAKPIQPLPLASEERKD